MRVLVYGGRTYNNRRAVFTYLDFLHDQQYPITFLIHGACHNRRDKVTQRLIWSADLLAQEWALYREIPYTGLPAKWQTGGHGKREGMLRNQLMLDKWRPERGIEFPGRTGTADMHDRLTLAGVPIDEYVKSPVYATVY